MSGAADEPRGDRPPAGISPRVAVLGPGAVGGMVAARVAAAGGRVVCVATPESAAAIHRDGIQLEAPDGTIRARPDAVELLAEPVTLLVVAVKAPALAAALERVEVFAVADGVVLPLLNGLEHPDVIRRRLGNRVAPGSISLFEGYRHGTGRIVQTTPSPLVTAASDDVPREVLAHALTPLGEAGLEVALVDDERAVLWEKAARLAVLAAATSVTQRPVGELRADRVWRSRLEAALQEACAVATADGVPLTAASQWEMIEAMPETLSTSTARDVAAGRASELDAISGSVLRAAARLGVAVPSLESLVQEAEAACRPR